jgi:hypothetical protein
MGLIVDKRSGIPVVHHGGSMAGYKSETFFLPDHGVGGVILTAADNGSMLRLPFLRRFLEVLFDGEDEAAGDLQSAIQRHKQELATERARMQIPPDPTVVLQLAAHYTSTSLGKVAIKRDGATATADFGEWKSAIATRTNDDGTSSIVTIDPGVAGLEAVIGHKDGKRALVIHDRQHEYMLVEAP